MDKQDERLGHLRLALVQQLESLQRSGVRQLPRPPAPPASPASTVGRPEATAGERIASPAVTPAPAALPREARPVPPRGPQTTKAQQAATPGAGRPTVQAGSGSPAPASPTGVASGPPPTTPEQRAAALDVIRREVAQCVRCAELAATRTQTVFGVGTPQPRLCFLGEAPGGDEDRRGEPFVGRAGELLNKIIEACTLRREDVYILNVLKCRPPGNRTPLPEEVANCRGYFERQLAILQPEFICCLGAVAAQALLRTTRAVGALRGKLHTYRDAQVLVTYHPSYLLRQPEMKREAWEDMKLLMRAMGLEVPAR
jgi:uracil-DNA glycosylase family 4